MYQIGSSLQGSRVSTQQTFERCEISLLAFFSFLKQDLFFSHANWQKPPRGIEILLAGISNMETFQGTQKNMDTPFSSWWFQPICKKYVCQIGSFP